MSDMKLLPIAVVDVETTGLDPEAEHILEIAVVHFLLGSDDTPTVRMRTRVKPPIPVPLRSTEIHGITDEDLADAPTWREASLRVVHALQGRVCMAYNAPFDFQFVRAEQARAGLAVLAPWPWLCAKVVAEHVDRKQSGKRLVDVARRRQLSLDAHGATADAMATAMLVTDIMRSAYKTANGPRGSTLREYFTWQRAAALRREREYWAWRERNGGEPPAMPWHELEGETPPEWNGAPTELRTHVDAEGVVHHRGGA